MISIGEILKNSGFDPVALQKFTQHFKAMDNPDNWIKFELFNPHAQNFIFTRLDVHYFGKETNYLIGPPQIVLPSDGHRVFPHGFYDINCKEPVSFVKNLGDEIGKGNKKLSAPGVSTQYV